MVSAPASDVINAGDGEEVGGELEGGRDGEGGVDAVVDVGDVAHVAVEQEPGHRCIVDRKRTCDLSIRQVAQKARRTQETLRSSEPFYIATCKGNI